jgi:hypothetical protein
VQQSEINVNVLLTVIGESFDISVLEFVCFVQKVILKVILKPIFV